MAIQSVTVKQIQDLDNAAIEEIEIPSLVLMENAGRSVAHEIIKQLRSKKNPRACIFCGLGNNAGDGYVVARYLINAGIQVKIFQIGTSERLKLDAAINCWILKNLRYPIKEFQSLNRTILNHITKADIVVDAIFGVGLNRPVRDPFKSVIEAINEKSKKIVSIDIPSGLDGTTGKIYGVCAKANITVTFSFAKKGFFKNAGPKHTGKVVVVDIGIPLRLKNRVAATE